MWCINCFPSKKCFLIRKWVGDVGVRNSLESKVQFHRKTSLLFRKKYFSFKTFLHTPVYPYFTLLHTEVFSRRSSAKKAFLKIWQNSQENTCTGISFLINLQILTYLQVLFCEFCKYFKNTFMLNNTSVCGCCSLYN